MTDAVLLLALLLAIASARKHGGIIDRASTIVSSMAIAVPPFWLGLLLIYGFAIRFSWFPAVGYRPIRDGVGPWFKSILMPAVALGAVPGAELTLQLKAALNEVMGRDYILTADAKGLRRNQVIVKHALKNAAVPVVTVLGFRIAQILAGAASIEFIFNIRGLGWVIYESAIGRDLPVLVGIVACSTLLVIAVNTLVDISYGYFNPKVRT